jgi:hypothetical protein
MGDYNPSATYSLLMTVLYNHDSWVCIAMTPEGDEKQITGIAPDDPTRGAENWQALTDGGRAAVAVGIQVRSEFNDWFGATASEGIRRTVSDWFATVQNAWSTWFSQTKTAWTDWFNSVKSAWTSWFGADATSGVQKQWATLKADSTAATSRANTAATTAEAWNTHPPYIGDGTTGDLNYWYLYDVTTAQYIKGPYAKGNDLDYDDMTPEEKQRLIDNIKADLVFASDADCAAAAAEIIFTPQA